MVAHNALERVYVGKAITEGVEPPEELVERVLLKARVTSIYSGPGKGKTWLALWLILKVIEQGLPVLFFDSENGLSIVSERLEALGADPDDIDKYLYYYPHPALDLRQETVQTYQELLNIKPALVVFDSWVNFLASAGLDENSSVDVEQWSVAYALSARNRDSAVLILDHVPKDGSGSRGSGRKKDMVDVQYSLASLMPFDRDSVGSITLKREKDREGWLPWSIHFDVGGDGTGGFKFEPTFEAEDADENEEAALEVLSNAFPEGGKAVEWQRACYDLKGMSRATFYRVKKSLVPSRVEQQGKIHRAKVSEVSEGLTKPDIDRPRGLRSTNPYVNRVGTRDSGETKSDTPAGNVLASKKEEGVLI